MFAPLLKAYSTRILQEDGKLSNSTRQSSCRDGEKYGEAAVKLLAAKLGLTGSMGAC
ncbi:Os04g0269800 [Oryza sativa Japonica Group]|uniref:Os04g0269800 protein n=1 Tax=Oryza sativa subsp. japonica TaxID=39947 RepID=A0A0P0W874_ORYSJ|nr:hypothetical protein EE612_022703 [Oryza sativa]BAS88319.1 Os04g0269800 [Oryza sativa Japonica Group]